MVDLENEFQRLAAIEYFWNPRFVILWYTYSECLLWAIWWDTCTNAIPVPKEQQFIDLDDKAPFQVTLSTDDEWILTFALEDFEGEDPLDNVDIEIADGMYVWDGRFTQDARIADERQTSFIEAISEGMFILKSGSLRERNEGYLIVEDRFNLEARCVGLDWQWTWPEHLPSHSGR